MAIPFSSGPRPYPGRRPAFGHPAVRTFRKNERIRAPEVRVIGADGKQVGILNTRDALRLAQQQGLDLIEVSPGTRPPVCRIADYGKFMYDQGKKQKDHKPHTSKLKEVKFRPRIEQHDYETKLRHAEEFLYEGNKVKLTLSFRGREMEHKDLGFDMIKRVLADLVHVGLPDQSPRLMGRNIALTISPLPPNKRKLKHNDHDEHGARPDGTRAPEDDHGHGHGHSHDKGHGHDNAHRAPAPAALPSSSAGNSVGATLSAAQSAPPPSAPPPASP
jgi:translation initiation factor IF-3